MNTFQNIRSSAYGKRELEQPSQNFCADPHHPTTRRLPYEEPTSVQCRCPAILDCLLLQILEAFLRYDENGVIHPSSHGRDNANWLRTMYSIRVYALNRADLVSERRALIQRIDHRLALIARLAELRSELKRSRDARIAGAVAETIADMIAEEIDALLDMRRSDQPYAGLARQLIRRPMGRSPRNSDRERGP